MEDKDKVWQPEFPALHTCVIIDARHSSRHEMLKDLKANNLFENMVEAKSLDDGMRILSNHVADACMLGPSVSETKAEEFLRKARVDSFSKDCALIAVIARAIEPADQDLSYSARLINAGAHGVIEIPCTKLVFMESMVRAVVAANANSPWSSVLIQATQFGVDPFSGEAKGPRFSSPDQPSPSMRKKIVPIMLGMPEVAPEFREILESIEAGNYELDRQGNPTPKTREAISKVVASVLRARDGQTDSMTPKFREFFEKALVEYFLDLKQYGPLDARNELKQKLVTYHE